MRSSEKSDDSRRWIGSLLSSHRTTNVHPLRKSGHVMRAYVICALIAAAVVPLLLISYDYAFLETCLAVLLLEICLYPTVRRASGHDLGLPTMPVFCGAYALQFALPIFTRDSAIELANGELRNLGTADVIASLVLAIIGICAIQIAFYWFRGSKLNTAIPALRLSLNKSKVVLYCVIVGLLLPLLFVFKGVIPDEYQLPLSSILRLLQNQILVVIGLLAWIVYDRKDSKIYKVWLYGLVLIASLRGVTSGALEETLVPIGVLFIVKWLYTGRVPIGPIAATLALVIFLSPVKAQYRQQVGLGEDQETSSEYSGAKALLWIEQATDYWTDTFTGSRDFAEATASATSRTDLIHQVAHIYSLTPSVVPYQYGATYSYFLVALIPRVIWPDKPVAGDSNNFFAVTYGITTEEGVKSTTFGVSLLGESFINFGWYGAVFIMLLYGLVLSLLQHSFGESRSGPGGQAVFLAFFVFFLNGIGSSAEILFGNILQNLLFGVLLLMWTREKGTRRAISRASREQLSSSALTASK
jgi:hypothetical protein